MIEKAFALSRYSELTTFAGINGGTTVTTRFGHETVLSLADKVVGAVKAGAIRHFSWPADAMGREPAEIITPMLSKIRRLIPLS